MSYYSKLYFFAKLFVIGCGMSRHSNNCLQMYLFYA